MSLQESINKRIKQRQEELKSQKEMLENLNASQQKISHSIKNTQDMINLISGALHELSETQKLLDAEKSLEVQP